MSVMIQKKIERLSLQRQAEVDNFVEFLLSQDMPQQHSSAQQREKNHLPETIKTTEKKESVPPKRGLKFDWCDGPDDPPEPYSSVELQHLATEWMVEKLEKNLGPQMVALPIGEGVILIPSQPLFTKLCDRIARVFTSHQVTAEDVLAGLPEAREQTFARLYPQLAANEPTRRPVRKKAK